VSSDSTPSRPGGKPARRRKSRHDFPLRIRRGPPEELCRQQSAAGVPSADSFCQVDKIPILGTGKIDLRRLKELALERFPPSK
jgi:hypothetical protein